MAAEAARGQRVPGHPRGFRKRVIYLEADQLSGSLIGRAVDTPCFPDRWLRRAISALHLVLRQPGDELRAESLLALLTEGVQAHLGLSSGPPPASSAAYLFRDLLEANVAEGVSL